MNENAFMPVNATSVFDIDDPNARNEYLRSLGAVNVDPPLPKSKFLKIKKTGRVLPWDELLAEHQDLVECCDAEGNTDPRAWIADVDTSETSEEDRALLMAQAQAAVLQSASAMTSGYLQQDAEDSPVQQSLQYPFEAQALSDLDVAEVTNNLKNMTDML